MPAGVPAVYAVVFATAVPCSEAARFLWRFSIQQGHDGFRANFGLRIGGERGFRHCPGDRRVAYHVNSGNETRFKSKRINRTPTGTISHS